MASKLTELTEDTSPSLDDLIYTVNNPAGTPGSRKVTLTNTAILFWNYLTSLTAKTTLVDADQFGIADSAASNVGKKITWQNVMTQAAAYTQTLTNKTLTTPTIGSFVNATHTHTSAATGGVITKAVIPFSATSSFSPADSTTYYAGGATWFTTEGFFKFYPMITGTITKVTITFTVSTIISSNETFTAYVRLNGTTDTVISSSCKTDDVSGINTFTSGALSIALTPTDYYEIKIVTPAWATNPTGARISGTVLIE